MVDVSVTSNNDNVTAIPAKRFHLLLTGWEKARGTITFSPIWLLLMYRRDIFWECGGVHFLTSGLAGGHYNRTLFAG